MNIYPKNIILSLPHGSYHIPKNLIDSVQPIFFEQDNRLLKNFSDFATRYLIPTDFPKDQIIIANFSRVLWDPNRSIATSDIFQETDFWGICFWKSPLTKSQKEKLLTKYYTVYHKVLSKKLETFHTQHKNIVLLDIHDTWAYLLTENSFKKREGGFPELNIWDGFWKYCDKKILKKISALCKKYLQLDISMNIPYSGGYISQNYSKKYSTLQLEFWRHLYMDENTQKIDKKKMKNLRENFKKVLINI